MCIYSDCHEMMICALRVLVAMLTVYHSSAANIVIFYFPLFGHIIPAANVGKVLQDQGHNITIILPPQLQERFASKRFHVLLYSGPGNIDASKEIEYTVLLSLSGGKTQRVGTILETLLEIADKVLNDQELFDKVRDCRPDLLILDPTPPARVMSSVIAYRFYGIPFIFIGASLSSQYSRVPLSPSVVPEKLFDYTDNMTFWQRFSNTLFAALVYIYDPVRPVWMLKEFISKETEVSITDIQAKALLWIAIDDGILGYNSPILPNVKLVSNLLEANHKPLPDEFQLFMDNAKNGVVIVSFGTILESPPAHIFEKFLTAFRKTKYNFVIRQQISNSSDPNKFLIRDWIPQLELLSHNNTRLFITHCGANGQQEAVYAGVPMIGFPVFAEQPHNAARIVRRGFGLRLDIQSFTVDELVSTIEEVITNPAYTKRTKKASAIVRSARVPPVEEAAYWINHVLTFGGDHLRSLGQDIPLWKYLGIDILAFCFLVWHIFLFIFVKTIYFLFYCCCMRQDKEKKE